MRDVPCLFLPPRLRARPGTRRGAALLVLIAAAVIGVRARQGASLSSGAHRLHAATWVTVVLSVGGLAVGAVALAFVLLVSWRITLRLRRKRDPDQPPHVVEQPVTGLGARLAALALALLVMGAAVGAVVLAAHVGGGNRGHTPAPVRTTRATPSAAPTRPPTGHAGQPDPRLLWVLITGLVLLVVITGLVILIRRRGSRRAGAVPPAPAVATASPSAAEAAVLGGDPRSAVIADYLAMERELARARLDRKPSETPMELLERAEHGGLETSQARQLAGLFTLARFSTRPVTDEQREQARRTLTAVRRQWAAGPASRPSAAGEERA